MMRFADLPLLDTLLTSLGQQDLVEPTGIQVRTLPMLLEGRSLVGVSATGSGKTLCYVLSMLHQLKMLELEGSSVTRSGRPRGLVLVPGRELGHQVCSVFKGHTHGTRLRVRSVIGGSAKRIARKNVAGIFEILVATPGRLVQLLDSGQLRLDDVRMVVFDEADQVVDAGFLPTAQRILGECPGKAQRVMFSATMPQALSKTVARLFNSPPTVVRTKGSQRVAATLETDNRQVVNGRRLEVLEEVLLGDPLMGTLVFANTRAQCDQIAEWLEGAGIASVTYRGQMDRAARKANLARFRRGEVNVLLSTDLGGRGLDIERVERVINVFLPQQLDNYLHRAGRTARAGRSGLVVNLVTQRDQPLLAKLRKRERS